MNFENKLVALVNKDIDVGVAMNAIAHMTLGLGNAVDRKLLQLDSYTDQNDNLYPNISKMPFIVLRGKSNEIRKAVQAARESSMHYGAFIHTMTGGSYVEQIENTRNTPEDSLLYYGAVLFGPWDSVSAITKRFSLYR
ncbi:MAG: DUF2000 domain-containing protein [Caedimonadaceae bacterium]|nr:MAG: DUF2000 domain-containing protein [Caedimonadaceae bacterium]